MSRDKKFVDKRYMKIQTRKLDNMNNKCDNSFSELLVPVGISGLL
jgi:hypothetical protein